MLRTQLSPHASDYSIPNTVGQAQSRKKLPYRRFARLTVARRPAQPTRRPAANPATTRLPRPWHAYSIGNAVVFALSLTKNPPGPMVGGGGVEGVERLGQISKRWVTESLLWMFAMA